MTRAGRRCRNRASAAGRCYVHYEREVAVEAELETIVAYAAVDDWRAAAWLLERRWPERWTRRRPEQPEPAVESDGLDDLASRRDARRAAR
jgi:hypothetical protein